MHLKKLELYGFKSFADKVEISFDEGITGVVGPNGSGKSNIGDAMRWVLGESSARSLRGAKMEDVIFNGTSKRKALGWCEVTLIFDNQDQTLPIEYSEVSISRRVYRNGQSEYLINRAECRRKDIVELFRDTGIGREGYSIIGQGQIADMLSHKPDERRDVFHEAAGIMKYRARRDEAQRRLDSTRNNIQRLSDILEEMERQLGPLKRQAGNARRYIDISKSLKELEINKFLNDYDHLQNEINGFTKKLNEENSYLIQEDEAISKNEKKANEFSDSIEEDEASINTYRRSIAELNDNISKSHGQELVYKERLSYANREQSRLFDEIEMQQSRITELRKEASDLEYAVNDKNSGSEKIKNDISDTKARIKALFLDIEKRQNEIDIKKNTMMNELSSLADKKSSVSRLEAMVESYSERKTEIEKSIEDKLHQKQIYDDVYGELKDTVQALEGEISELSTQAQEKKAELSEVILSRSEHEADLMQKRDRANGLSTKMDMLKSLINDYEGMSNPVKHLLSNDESKSLIEGIVADVIDVPDEYITAVERALAGAMQHIVTKSDDEAKRLIAILRKNHAGRATFLPISAIKGRFIKEHEQHVERLPGCIGVAADLFDFEDKYYHIVYSLLGRTVLCYDLDAATEAAKSVKHSLRFVTLKGDIVHTGGSMSGGSGKSSEYSPIKRRKELEETVKLFEAAKSQMRKAEDELSKVENILEQKKEHCDILVEKLNDAKVAYAQQKERFDKLISSYDKNKEEMELLTQQQARIEENINDAQREIVAISQTSQSESRQGDVSREQLQKEQANVNQLRADHDHMQRHLQDLMAMEAADEKEKATAQQKIQWLLDEATRAEEQIKQKRQQHEKNKELSEKQTEMLTDSKSSADDDQTRLENLKNLLSDKIVSYEHAKKELKDINQLLATGNKRRNELSEKIHALQMKYERSKMEHEQIQHRIWDYYELTYQGTLEYRNDNLDMTNADEQIDRMRRQIKAMGTVNVNAVADYAELNGRYTEHKKQYDDLTKAEADLISVINGLNKQMKEKFVKEFKILNDYFSDNFTKLFGGGRAQLSLSDEEDILNSGIIIEAQPPGKKLQMISLLSGGEKALTATAILFSFLNHRPSPFCLLDEIETALDDANLYHFTDFLKRYAEDTQFVVITHRRPTMESCDILYGVTMEEKGVSKMVSVKIADYK